jgi:dephospho-CoA kinase
MANPIIVAVVGLIGSGKTEATERFRERGFARFGYNDVFYEELSRLKLERNEKNERMVREGLRKESGMAVAAIRTLPKIETAFSRGENAVVESLYSWSEYKATKEKFGCSFKVLAIYASPSTRYERLSGRPVRPLTLDEAKSRDYAEIENLEKGGPIAMADWTIQNIGIKKKFLSDVDSLIDEILG